MMEFDLKGMKNKYKVIKDIRSHDFKSVRFDVDEIHQTNNHALDRGSTIDNPMIEQFNNGGPRDFTFIMQNLEYDEQMKSEMALERDDDNNFKN